MNRTKIFTVFSLFLSVFFIGCAAKQKGDIGPAGPKGDTGDPGGTSSIINHVYEGHVDDNPDYSLVNPYSISIPEITGSDSQHVECYMQWYTHQGLPNQYDISSWVKLPYIERNEGDPEGSFMSHEVIIGTGFVKIHTYQNGGDYWGPILMGRPYKIIVRNFASPQLKAKWLELNKK